MDHRSTTFVVRRRAPRLVTVLLLALSLGLSGPAAQARKDTEVAKESCKATSDVKLKAEPDGTGVIKVIAVVFSEDDDVWDWRLKRNDEVSAKGSVKAKDADRSFRIIRTMVDPPGTDDIGFRAQNTATGEVCSIVVPY
jgi:hypothetical protein